MDDRCQGCGGHYTKEKNRALHIIVAVLKNLLKNQGNPEWNEPLDRQKLVQEVVEMMRDSNKTEL